MASKQDDDDWDDDEQAEPEKDLEQQMVEYRNSLLISSVNIQN